MRSYEDSFPKTSVSNINEDVSHLSLPLLNILILMKILPTISILTLLMIFLMLIIS